LVCDYSSVKQLGSCLDTKLSTDTLIDLVVSALLSHDDTAPF